jgi:hypothetical protein
LRARLPFYIGNIKHGLVSGSREMFCACKNDCIVKFVLRSSGAKGVEWTKRINLFATPPRPIGHGLSGASLTPPFLIAFRS